MRSFESGHEIWGGGVFIYGRKPTSKLYPTKWNIGLGGVKVRVKGLRVGVGG